jgi:hypothetical protein
MLGCYFVGGTNNDILTIDKEKATECNQWLIGIAAKTGTPTSKVCTRV